MGNSIKVGEVDDACAIVWTRLTQKPERKTEGHGFVIPEGTTLKISRQEISPPTQI